MTRLRVGNGHRMVLGSVLIAVGLPPRAGAQLLADRPRSESTVDAQERSCWLDPAGDVVLRNVSGGIGGTTVVISPRGTVVDPVIQTHVGEADVCIRTHGEVRISESLRHLDSIAPGGWLVMGSRSNGRTMELTVVPSSSGQVGDWRIDGEPQPIDRESIDWRDAMLPIVGSYLLNRVSTESPRERALDRCSSVLFSAEFAQRVTKAMEEIQSQVRTSWPTPRDSAAIVAVMDYNRTRMREETDRIRAELSARCESSVTDVSFDASSWTPQVGRLMEATRRIPRRP